MSQGWQPGSAAEKRNPTMVTTPKATPSSLQCPASVEIYVYLGKPSKLYPKIVKDDEVARAPAVAQRTLLASAHGELRVALVRCQDTDHRGWWLERLGVRCCWELRCRM